MSLILDALKKLERDKETGDPGVLVVGAVPWEGVRRRRMPGLTLAFGALLVLGGTAFGVWWLSRTPRSGPAPTPAASAASTATAAGPSAPLAPRTAPAETVAGATAAPQPRLAAPPASRPMLLEGATDAAPAASAPREAAPPLRAGLQLNAISRQNGRPVAVIDGRLVHEGDSVDGVRVLHIGETDVEVEVHGQRRTLRF